MEKKVSRGNPRTIVKKQLELHQATQALINIFAASKSKQEFLDNVVGFIQQERRFNSVGIRVLDKDGNIPYESYIGFSREFWEAENMLSILKDECVCTRVVKGQPLPCDMPVISRTGSFCCSDIATFVEALSEQEIQLFRRVCIMYGFRSIAVVPIRYRGVILGAVHMADPNPDTFTSTTIEFIETIIPLIGEVLSRHTMEQTLKYSEVDLLTESIRRKQVEHILEQSQHDFQSILDSIPVVICRFDKNLRFVYVNAAFTAATGYPPEYYIGKTYNELEHQADIGQISDKYIREVFETGDSKFFENTYYHDTGVKYYRILYIPEFDDNHNVKSVLNVNQDISESVLIRKQQEALLRAENRLFIGGPVVAYKRRLGEGGRMEYISPNVNQFGYEQQDFLSGKLDYSKLIHPEDVRLLEVAVKSQSKDKRPYSEIEFRIQRADGEYRWVYDYKILLTDENGVVSGIQGYLLDITERKNAEKALWESNKKYHELVEDANVIIMHLDEKGQILFINDFGLKFFGFQLTELLNHSFRDTILPQYESTGRNLTGVFDDMFSNPAKHEHVVLETVRKDGRRAWIEWTNRFSNDPVTGRSQLITVGVDITARRQAEASLKLNYERYRRNKLVGDMLENRISEDEFLGMAKNEGLALQTPVACCLLKFDFSDSRFKFLMEDRKELQVWMETAIDLISAHLGGVVWQGEQQIAVLQHISNQSNSSLTAWVANLSAVMKEFLCGATCVIGVSTIHSEMKVAYRQANEAVTVGPIFNPENHIFYWRDLGVCKLILEQANSSVGNAFIEEWIGPLVKIPSLKNQELLSTLKELLSGDTITVIANRLHVHPKTLVFRKSKIEQVLRKKLDDSETRLNIAVALKLKQLQEKLSI